MKTLISTSLIILLIISTALGQENKFQVGVDGGPSSSQIYGYDSYFGNFFFASSLAFSVSSTFQYNFTNHIALVSGIGYERKGNQMKDYASYLTDEFGNPIGPFKIKVNYNYINIPLQVRYTMGVNDFRFFANFGGYLGLLTNATSKLVGDSNPNIDQGDISEYIQSSDFGISGGLGTQYAISNAITISLEIRNNLGLYNVSKSASYTGGTNKLNTTNLLIGVNYGFGK
tara:strand:+ start:66940 stop:67626 length:687 start_codon:yes stop_codon:yes gene_type:complete